MLKAALEIIRLYIISKPQKPAYLVVVSKEDLILLHKDPNWVALPPKNIDE